MSLEKEIAQLREAVVALTEALEDISDGKIEKDDGTGDARDSADDVSIDPNEGGMMPTRKELTDIALGISRKDSGAKVKIKAILEEHGAATITKLDDDQLYAVWEKLEVLKKEVGA